MAPSLEGTVSLLEQPKGGSPDAAAKTRVDSFAVASSTRTRQPVSNRRPNAAEALKTLHGWAQNPASFSKRPDGFSQTLDVFSQSTGVFLETAGGFPENADDFLETAVGFPENADGFSQTADGFPKNAGPFFKTAGVFAETAGGFSEIVSPFSKTTSGFGGSAGGRRATLGFCFQPPIPLAIPSEVPWECLNPTTPPCWLAENRQQLPRFPSPQASPHAPFQRPPQVSLITALGTP